MPDNPPALRKHLAVLRAQFPRLLSAAVWLCVVGCDVPNGVEPALPDEPVCGNGVVEAPEQCDPGAADAGAAAGSGATCSSSCLLVPETDIDFAGPSDLVPTDDCDLSGYWLARKDVDSLVPALSNLRVRTRHWMWLKVEQAGDEFEVVESFTCGFHSIAGDLGEITLDPQTRAALGERETLDGRRGSYVDNGQGGCDLRFDRHYVARGVEPAEYWLADDWAGQDLPTLPLPAIPDCQCMPGNPGNCTCDDVGRYDGQAPGWDDWDGDGLPGISLRFSTGTLFMAIWDWDEFFGTTAQGLNTPNDELRLNVDWGNYKLVLGLDNTLNADDRRDPDLEPHSFWMRRTRTDLRANNTGEQVCAYLREVFPIDERRAQVGGE